ncbi:39S ribosomal protein L27, mitochondrial-like [Biomphalaria glabrata]|uniref:39S ribosomal protein L27, mitochondrial-like n=1 Tax=Biomphalaria glabrata TaxID=6526 RepID=A0A9W3B4D3_BIOGL|nr:39S ribosomal protein L27, mitochondrial-like [Biomphalaria glabrata]XP_055894286.1 39S ribosomal protein L27, mitochondrial-like [Biomphalaria glabrata]
MASRFVIPLWKSVCSAVATLKPAMCQPMSSNLQYVRYASKKASATPRNRIGRTKRKHRGIKAHDGTFVHKGDILATQFGLRFYPGENVVMDDKWTLKAAFDGIVVISTETLNPYPDSPLYLPVQKGAVLQKKFFHIIPTPLHGKFKLVSEV